MMKRVGKFILIGLLAIMVFVSCSKGDEDLNNLSQGKDYEETVTRDNSDLQEDTADNEQNKDIIEDDIKEDNKEQIIETQSPEQEENTVSKEDKVTFVGEDVFESITDDKIKGELSLNEILENFNLPEDFNLKDYSVWKDIGVDWNYASFLTDMYVLVGDDNTVIGTFRWYNNQWTYKCDYNVSDLIYIFDNRIIVSGVKESEKKICFDVFDYYGNKISSYTQEVPDLISGIGPGPKDFNSFYYFYKTDEQLKVALLDFENDTVIYDKNLAFKEEVKNIWVEKNSYIIERTCLVEENQLTEIDISNLDFDILDRKIITIKDIHVNDCRFEYGTEAIRLVCTLTKDNEKYQGITNLQNQYQENYPLNVLALAEDNPYDPLKEECYHIDHPSYKQYDNFKGYGKVRVLDGNYLDINFFYNIHNGAVVKELGNGSVAQSLGDIGLDNDSRFIQINDVWVGLTADNTINYVDNNDETIATLMDRTLFGRKTFYNRSERMVYYIDGENNYVYSMDEQGNENKITEVSTEIIANITKEINEGGHWSFYASKQYVGIGNNYGYLLFYKGIEEEEWQTIKIEEFIRESSTGIYYNDFISGCKMYFNYDKKEFDPLYTIEKEPYSSIILDDQVYINYEEDFVEGETLNLQVVESEYLEYDFFGVKYKLLNVLNEKDSTYFREFESRNIYTIKEDKVVNILNKKVRLFDVHNQYVAYTSYNKESGLYILNQETGEEQLLFSEDAVASVAIREPYIFYTTTKNKSLYRYNLDTTSMDIIEEGNISDVFVMENLIVYKNMLDEKLYLCDMDTLEYKDSFEASSYKKYNQYIIYSSIGTLIKYDVTTGKDTIILYSPYPGIHDVHNDIIYYGIYIDGPAPLLAVDLDDTLNLKDLSGLQDLGDGKYLFYENGDFATRLWFYDQTNEKFSPLCGGDTVKYTVELPYIYYEYKNYKSSGKYQFNVNDYSYEEIK